MTARQLYPLVQDLRLLARANVLCDQAGRLLRGGIDQQVETLRQRVLNLLERLQDGHTPTPEDADVYNYALMVINTNRATLRDLKREI